MCQGEVEDYVTCKQCGNNRCRLDAFQDISLVVNPNGKDDACSITDAIDYYLREETMDGDNKVSCETCKTKTEAFKGLRLAKLPKILFLQLKRFDFDYNTERRHKLHNEVRFPMYLNMNTYMSWKKETKTGAGEAEAGRRGGGGADGEGGAEGEGRDGGEVRGRISGGGKSAGGGDGGGDGGCKEEDADGKGDDGGGSGGEGSKRRISQETFDEVVQENIKDFAMDPDEAVADAIAQFKTQRVDLGNIDIGEGVLGPACPLTDGSGGGDGGVGVGGGGGAAVGGGGRVPDLVDALGGAPPCSETSEKVAPEGGTLQEARAWLKEEGEFVYELYSVLVHSGEAGSGHYYAYIKDMTDTHGTWNEFNDSTVSGISVEAIRKTWGGKAAATTPAATASSYHSRWLKPTNDTSAYMLLYRQLDSATIVDDAADPGAGEGGGGSESVSDNLFLEALQGGGRPLEPLVPEHVRAELDMDRLQTQARDAERRQKEDEITVTIFARGPSIECVDAPRREGPWKSLAMSAMLSESLTTFLVRAADMMGYHVVGLPPEATGEGGGEGGNEGKGEVGNEGEGEGEGESKAGVVSTNDTAADMKENAITETIPDSGGVVDIDFSCIRLRAYSTFKNAAQEPFDSVENGNTTLRGLRWLSSKNVALEVVQPGEAFAAYDPKAISVAVFRYTHRRERNASSGTNGDCWDGPFEVIVNSESMTFGELKQRVGLACGLVGTRMSMYKLAGGQIGTPRIDKYGAPKGTGYYGGGALDDNSPMKKLNLYDGSKMYVIAFVLDPCHLLPGCDLFVG